MKDKRILVCNAQIPFQYGGAEIMVENLQRELEKRGFPTQMVQLPYRWYPPEKLFDSAFAWRLIDLTECNGIRPDLVIATKFPSYVAEHPNKVTWLMHQYRGAYDLYDSEFTDLHGEEGEQVRRRIVEMDNRTLAESKALYAISQTVADRLDKYNHLQAECLYQPPKNPDRFYSEDYGDYILSVGRLDKLKRLELLIQALKYCDPHIRAKIAGRGSQQQALMELAQQEGVADRVDFLGFVEEEEVYRLYANAFSVFFAPKDEDYGFVTLEAFLSRKPVVTCRDSGGVLEFVRDGESGWVCSTPEELGEAIHRLWLDKAACARMGEAGYDRVRGITWDHVIEELTKTL
jgi:glycosyltransferase involved in cell wall biosynthesis